MDINGVHKCDVLIAGAGPAGLASSLYLLRERPELAGRVVALEKARHPRVKVCAGGLIPKTVSALNELDLALDVPAVRVMNGVAATVAGDVHIRASEPVCTIVRRDRFDAMLAKAAQARGLELVENCHVSEIEEHAGGVVAKTSRGTFEAPVLIGADGSGSQVRDSLFSRTKHGIGRALMMDVPVDAFTAPEFRDHLYRFDFRCVDAGVAGYSWSFPCIIGERTYVNVGIYEQFASGANQNPRSHSGLIHELSRAFPEFQIQEIASHAGGYKAFPIRWFDPAARFASSSTILAGDAAGVDPLMGEGISCAFDHGRSAAKAAAQFLDGNAGALAEYDRELHLGAVGRKLRRLGFAARRFYGPHHRLYFRLASLSRSAQRIGVDWYNGQNAYDELPVSTLVGKWLTSVLLRRSVR